MFTADQIEILTKASGNFPFFVDKIFSLSVKNFIRGEHVHNVARFLSQNKKTIRVSARHHFKSFAFYAYFMWKLMFEGANNNLESHYFSFNAELAGYHINKIKQCIESNPYFEDIKDHKPTAETVLKYSWDNKHFTTITPHGLVQFKRGIHGDLIFVDDPFQDPENELNPLIIYKINEIFKTNIMDMPKEPDGELHVCGTAQTNDDFFFDKALTSRFKTIVSPAITKDQISGEEKALWPEWMSLEELYRKREERSERIFSKEFLCTPVYSTKGFFNKEKILTKIVNKDLSLWRPHIEYSPISPVIAGFDIGKKTHPSHLAVFEFKNNKLSMIHQKFMDGWSYSNGRSFEIAHPTQLEYLKEVIKNFKIKELRYDNTRGEFESFSEQNLLPREMVPVVFTQRMKTTGASIFDKLVERSQIEIPNDERLIDQICVVTNELQAIQTKWGHGDCYDDKTEVLTKSGWKFFNDLSFDDDIATLRDQNFLEYQKPTNIIKEHYNGKMYKIDTTQVSLVVTPRHKLFVNLHPQRKNKIYELVKPEQIEGKQVLYKKDAIWEGEEKEFFKLDDVQIPMDTFLRYIGYYVSEGYTAHEKTIFICQMPGWKSDEMYKNLKCLPFNVKHSEKPKTEGVHFCSKKLVKWTKENLGRGAINKHLPDWVFSLSSRQLKILLDALVLGDGSYANWPGHVGTNNGYGTVSKKLADQVQELSLKVGWSSNIYFRDSNIGRKGMFGVGNYRGYTVSFIQTKNKPSVHRHIKSDRWVKYNGNIYCVTVPNQVIYVRRDGKPVWSGNSFWSIVLAIGCETIRDITSYSDDSITSYRKRITAGQSSIFDNPSIPKGF